MDPDEELLELESTANPPLKKVKLELEGEGEEESKEKEKTPPPPPRRRNSHASNPRQRFTVEEKVSYIKAFEATKGVKQTTFLESLKPVIIKKTTFSDWLKEKDRLTKRLAASELGLAKRKAIHNDPLWRVKLGVVTFYEQNKQKSCNERIHISGTVVSAQAKLLRNDLLEKDRAQIITLTDSERDALNKFTASDSWGRKIVGVQGWNQKERIISDDELDQWIEQTEMMCTQMENDAMLQCVSKEARDLVSRIAEERRLYAEKKKTDGTPHRSNHREIAAAAYPIVGAVQEEVVLRTEEEEENDAAARDWIAKPPGGPGDIQGMVQNLQATLQSIQNTNGFTDDTF